MRSYFKSPLFSRCSKGKVRHDCNEKPAPIASPLPPNFKPGVCRCKRTENGRNLVICIDGTSNQFCEKNTNVIELYSMLEKGRKRKQLTWYHSGIGTYARPSFKSPAFYLQVLSHLIDLAIAWNFERTIMAAYEWLSENYEEGDCIYLFGFSRGAFQVRVLAAMIDKVGLIHKGNAKQIPFAYELYCDPESDKPSRSKTSTGSSAPLPKRSLRERFQKILRRHNKTEVNLSKEVSMAQHFKNTFSQPDVRVHFVGVWDTVSSIGVVRGKKMLPRTVDGMEHVCYFRHALALDERRVKFLPEYAYGGSAMPAPALQKDGSATSDPRSTASKTSMLPGSSDERPQTLEVWFAGTHSDIGGGNTANPDMNRSRPPLRWMVYEARSLGLRTRLFERELLPTEKIELIESLSGVWKLFEIIPWRRLTFTTRKNGKEVTHKPHLGDGRKVQDGQRIHISVLDGLGEYHPKARPPQNAEKLWSLLKSDITLQRIWQEGDADTFVKPLVASFVKKKIDSAWITVCGMAKSGDGLQAAYEEVMRFITEESDYYKADDGDKLRLLESAMSLLSNKSLRLRGSKELEKTMIELGTSHNLGYQKAAWDFLSRFVQYSNDTVFPIQFISYLIEQLCGERGDISRDVLHKICSGDENVLQATYEEVMKFLMAETVQYKANDSDKLRLLQYAKTLFSNKPLRLRDSRELGQTMIKICASDNPMYQAAAWAFLTEFLQYSSNMVVPTEFLCYNITRLFEEKCKISFDILQKVIPEDESPFRDLCKFTTHYLIHQDIIEREELEIFVEILKEGSVSHKRLCDVKSMVIKVLNCANKQYRDAAWTFLDQCIDCEHLQLEGHTDGVLSVAYSADGAQLVSGSNDITIRIWNALTGKQLGQPLTAFIYKVNCVTISRDGSRIVSASDKNIHIWNAASGKKVGETLDGHTDLVRSVAISPDDKHIVSCSDDRTLRIWDMQTGEQLGQPLKAHTDWVVSVVFSPDGRFIVSSSCDTTIRIWDAKTRQQICPPLDGHRKWVWAVAFSHDGTQIVSGSSDKTIRVWDFATRKQVGEPLEGHTQAITSVAFSPDGKHIVSSSSDCSVRIWDTATGMQIGEPLKGHSGFKPCSVAFSPDGKQVVSSSLDKKIWIWDISLKLRDVTD